MAHLTETLRNALSSLFSDSKMILIVNMELNMGRGKQCAQVAHAALGLFLKVQQSDNALQVSELIDWLERGQKKIVVKGDNLNHLLNIKTQAEATGLPTYLVSDAGCTQIPPGSKTVLAIFGKNQVLDTITGSLRLL